MENFIKVVVFAFIAIWAQAQAFDITAEDIKTWSKKFIREIFSGQ